MTLEELFERTSDYVQEHHWGTYPYKHYELLKLLVSVHKPKRILELGTAIGLSAIAMAQGFDGSKIDTIEKTKLNIDEAKKYAEIFGVTKQINFIEGAFIDEVPKLKIKYDFIFFDGFSPHFEMIIFLEKILKSGGIMVFANLNIGDEAELCKMRLLDSRIYSSSFYFDDTAISVKA